MSENDPPESTRHALITPSEIRLFNKARRHFFETDDRSLSAYFERQSVFYINTTLRIEPPHNEELTTNKLGLGLDID